MNRIFYHKIFKSIDPSLRPNVSGTAGHRGNKITGLQLRIELIKGDVNIGE